MVPQIISLTLYAKFEEMHISQTKKKYKKSHTFQTGETSEL